MVVVRVVFSKIVSYILHARFPEDVGVPLSSAVLWLAVLLTIPHAAELSVIMDVGGCLCTIYVMTARKEVIFCPLTNIPLVLLQ